MSTRLHRPTLLKVREWIARDLELAEEAERDPRNAPELRKWEQQRIQTFRAQLTDIDAAIEKAKDF